MAMNLDISGKDWNPSADIAKFDGTEKYDLLIAKRAFFRTVSKHVSMIAFSLFVASLE